MQWIGLGAIVTMAAGVGIVFAGIPHLDLDIAVHFRDRLAEAPESHWYDLITITRGINQVLTIAIMTAAAATLAFKVALPRMPMLMPARMTVLILVTGLLGPILLVNGILKEQWGRPRPGETIELGGTLAFKPWWDMSGECRSNCSFASGEASSAFALLAVASVAPTPWTGPALVATAAFATSVGAGRVATTGHYVSDVAFGALISCLLVWLAHGFLYRWRTTRTSDAALEAWLQRLAEAGRRRTLAAVSRLS
jgi:membrane-associated phospholipid phosphatase